MPLYSNNIRAPASSTDDALVRFDGTSGTQGQDTNDTLTDTGVLTLPDTTAQIIAGGSAGTFTVAGATLTPRVVSHTSAATEPNVAYYRDSGSASGGATHNFFRSLAVGSGGPQVANGNSLLIISALGHDSVDYAVAATIDVVVDDATVGSNKMGGKIRFLTSPAGTQSPQLALSIDNAKDVLFIGTATIPNTGLHLLDTNASHDLIVAPGSDLSADRTLTITTGDANRTLTLPLYWSMMLSGNSGTVTNGTTTYFTGGSATAGVGVVPLRALHITRMTINFLCATATTSGVVDARFTLLKNSNDPAGSNRILVADQLNLANSTGYMISTSTIVDAGMDAIDGVDDYLVLAIQATVATSFALTGVNVLIEGTLDA